MLTDAATVPPLTLAEFAVRMDRLGGFETRPFLAVAVSGGPDSLALALLADRWAREKNGTICALSVDHGLRPGSGGELRELAAWLAARAIPHQILAWQGPKPATRIQERARAERYRLLESWCQGNGCLHLLMGHHREDQIETHLLRRDARSGAHGLAGMSSIREIASCRIVRPLLDVPKHRLLATLRAERQPFISDPSNRNPVYARARLRQSQSHPDAGRLFDEVRQCGRDRVKTQRGCDALLGRAVALHPAGFATLEPQVLLAAPADLAERALSALVWTLGGGAYPPRRCAVVRLLRSLAGMAPGGHTLGGLRFVAWRARILVLRELAAAEGEVRIEPGSRVRWDNRFTLSLVPGAAPLRVRYLGTDGVVELNRQRPSSRGRSLPALVHPVLPGLWDQEGLAAVPFLAHRRDPAVVAPRLVLGPVKSLSGASFAVV